MITPRALMFGSMKKYINPIVAGKYSTPPIAGTQGCLCSNKAVLFKLYTRELLLGLVT